MEVTVASPQEFAYIFKCVGIIFLIFFIPLLIWHVFNITVEGDKIIMKYFLRNKIIPISNIQSISLGSKLFASPNNIKFKVTYLENNNSKIVYLTPDCRITGPLSYKRIFGMKFQNIVDIVNLLPAEKVDPDLHKIIKNNGVIKLSEISSYVMGSQFTVTFY